MFEPETLNKFFSPERGALGLLLRLKGCIYIYIYMCCCDKLSALKPARASFTIALFR